MIKSSKLKVVTVVGTRPEIIRLSCVIKRLENVTDHVLVHTGQNYDYELNEVFFEDLGLSRPQHFLEADTTSLGSVLGDVLRGTEKVLLSEQPDAMVVLGDTNSCISALMARRMKVPVYHLEAGNRSFDANVPEEINRHLVDHVSDYNLVYSEHSRRNLLAEGIHPKNILLMGSPMLEVLMSHKKAIEASTILDELGLESNEYFLASIHREENVDREDRLESVLESLSAVSEKYDKQVLVSTHPRTRKRIAQYDLDIGNGIRLHPPLGFLDYNKLQMNAHCVLSDSGTIAEESTILGFPAVTLRDAIERPEAIETGGIITTGLNPRSVLDAVKITVDQHAYEGLPSRPSDYSIGDSSRRVINFIRSTTMSHHFLNAIRK